MPFRVAEEQLLVSKPGLPSIMERLIEAGVSVSVLHGHRPGQSAGAHFMNRKIAGKFIDPIQAAPWGFDGHPINAGNQFMPFVRWSNWNNFHLGWNEFWSTHGDRRAANPQENGGHRPTGLMAELAIRTGGYYCPLLPTAPSSNYADHDGDPNTPRRLVDAARTEGSQQLQAVEELTPAEQAQWCIGRALGLNPYSIQELWKSSILTPGTR